MTYFLKLFKSPKKTPVTAVLFFTLLLALLMPGCFSLPGVRPFKLDITVDYKEQTTQIKAIDQQGKVVYNQTFTKESS